MSVLLKTGRCPYFLEFKPHISTTRSVGIAHENKQVTITEHGCDGQCPFISTQTYPNTNQHISKPRSVGIAHGITHIIHSSIVVMGSAVQFK